VCVTVWIFKKEKIVGGNPKYLAYMESNYLVNTKGQDTEYERVNLDMMLYAKAIRVWFPKKCCSKDFFKLFFAKNKTNLCFFMFFLSSLLHEYLIDYKTIKFGWSK